MAPFPSPTTTWHENVYPAISPTRPENSAKGKSVVITGGGTGIGAETARSFAQAGAARIALLGRREQPLLETRASILEKFPEIEVFTAPTDITKKSQVDTAFAQFTRDQTKVDIMISNAATAFPKESVRDIDPDAFLNVVHVSFAGALLVAQAFLRHAASNAVVVNVSSSAAHLSLNAISNGGGYICYNTAKLGVFRFWDTVANGHPQLSVFHIQPGVVNTDMNRDGVAMGFDDHG